MLNNGGEIRSRKLGSAVSLAAVVVICGLLNQICLPAQIVCDNHESGRRDGGEEAGDCWNEVYQDPTRGGEVPSLRDSGGGRIGLWLMD